MMSQFHPVAANHSSVVGSFPHAIRASEWRGFIEKGDGKRKKALAAWLS